MRARSPHEAAICGAAGSTALDAPRPAPPRPPLRPRAPRPRPAARGSALRPGAALFATFATFAAVAAVAADAGADADAQPACARTPEVEAEAGRVDALPEDCPGADVGASAKASRRGRMATPGGGATAAALTVAATAVAAAAAAAVDGVDEAPLRACGLPARACACGRGGDARAGATGPPAAAAAASFGASPRARGFAALAGEGAF